MASSSEIIYSYIKGKGWVAGYAEVLPYYNVEIISNYISERAWRLIYNHPAFTLRTATINGIVEV